MASRCSTLTSSKTAVWNMCQIAFPQQSSLDNDLRLLQRICNNIFTHFAESWHLSFTEMHGEKVGGVSCFVLQTHTNIEHYKLIFGNIETVLQW